jgi:hypothetical protein
MYIALWDRCYDFLYYFRQKNSKSIGVFLTQNKAKFFKNLIITLVFVKNAIFCRKLSKIAENCDHNIGPWLAITNGSCSVDAPINLHVLSSHLTDLCATRSYSIILLPD